MRDVHPSVREALASEDLVTMGFSTGKDSIATAIVLQEMGVNFIPIFFFHCPDLEFVDENIRHCEKHLGIEVVRMPHPMLYDYLRHQDFQGPSMIEHLEDMAFPKLTFEDLTDTHLASIGHPGGLFDAAGVRASESFNRRMLFKQRGHVDHKNKKIYPICDWNTADVLGALKERGVPLTKDYTIWNRSFDGLKYQFLFGVKKHHPKDWQTMLEYFPHLELELFRYEANIQYYDGTRI